MPDMIVSATQVMNFLCKFLKVGFIFFSFLGLSQPLVFSQYAHFKLFDKPHVQVIYPNDLNISGEYFQILQDRSDNIFLAAEHGILKFNGKNWSFIGIPGPVCLALSEDQVLFTGGNDIFGTIGTGHDGQLTFIPAPGKDPQNEFHPGQISRIITLRDEVYILSEKGLFSYQSGTFTEILHDSSIHDIFNVKGKIYLSSLSGLELLTGTSAASVLPAYRLGGHQINDVFPISDSIFIIVDGRKEMYVVSGNEMLPANLPCLQKSPTKEVRIIKTLPGFYLLEDTGINDLIICDAAGDMFSTITGMPGTHASSIRDIYFDGYDNLWMVQKSSVSRVELFSPLTFFSVPAAIWGEISDLTRLGEQLLVSSSSGLFAISGEKGSHGRTVTEIHTNTDHPVPFHGMTLFGESLLVGSKDGIYQYRPASGLHLVSSVPARCITRSFMDTTVFYAGLETGIYLLKYDQDVWIDLGKAEGIDKPVTSICETRDGYVWAGTFNAGLFKASVPEHFRPDKKITFAPANVLPPSAGYTIRLSYLYNTLLASTYSGMFQYDEVTGTFTPNRIYVYISDRVHLSQPVFTGNQSVAWISFYDPDAGKTILLSFDPRTDDPGSLDTLEYRRLDDIQIYSMFCDYPALWLSTSVGPAMIDINYPHPQSPRFFTFIDRVTINHDSVIRRQALEAFVTAGRELKRELVIPHSRNNLLIGFISTDYNSEGNALFQYILSGKKMLVSGWTGNTQGDLQDLPWGHFIFSVRSKDIYGNVSNPALLAFRIKAPFYIAWWAFIVYGICILFLIYFYRKWQHFQRLKIKYKLEEIIRERTESLLKEKEKTDTLLANILPQKTADELKSTGKASTSKFKMVTVLFSDIQGFTKIAEQMNPDKLIDELDKFYFQFDTVVEKYNIEKIKTIGDAYMAAGGIPVKNRTNPVEVVLAGLEMQHYMNELKKSNTNIWDLRIGIHTGSVIAGVVGQKKFTYDIWGDTVNTASRMESSGQAGKVNISGTCYNLVQQFFDCEYRGKMPVKYKGDIDMYFVKGLKPEFRADLEYMGNQQLQIQMQLLRLQDLEEIIMQRLETDIPEYLFYHNASHTAYVYAQVELLGRSEGINDEDMLLVRTAALLHDIGYIYQFEDHEQKSVDVTREILPSYKFTQDQIDKICKLILATAIPHVPENHLEQIIIDANLDHLGRVDFLILSDRLFQEYRTMKIFNSKKEWNEHQVNFLINHEFFTAAARSLREISRNDQIENIRKFS